MVKNIPIVIPTKRYIRAFLISEFGEKPLMDGSSLFGMKLYDLLSHREEETVNDVNYRCYDSTIKLYINSRTYYQRGGFISQNNIKNFNQFIEDDIKRSFRLYMDFYIELSHSFEENLDKVRKLIGIDIEDWRDDSIKKDYYRYRLRTGKPLLYKKNSIKKLS